MLIIIVFALFEAAYGLKITPEIPKDLSIQLCTHDRRETHGQMQYFPRNFKYCMAIKTNKNQRHKEHDVQGTTLLDSRVQVVWRRVNDIRSCRVVYDGYQSEYLLSPDFGAYPGCQHSMAKHLHMLAEGLAEADAHNRVIPYNGSTQDCPIAELPNTYADYISCDLQPNEWYLITYTSNIRYETFQDRAYGIYHANHSTAWLFQPNDILSRNGSETAWLKRLLTLNTKSDGCERGSVLVSFDHHWPLGDVEVAIGYRVRKGHTKVHSEHVATTRIDRWETFHFDLHPTNGVHEVCAHLTDTAWAQLRHHVCAQIIDEVDCPFANSSANFIPSIFIILISVIFCRTLEQ